MDEDPNRWEGVYQSKAESETSWFEERPQVSLDLIAATGATSDAAIVDVGAGASRLVDCLLDQGFHRITVLDLSDTALAKARARLPDDAPVEWVVANVLDWQPSSRFDVWHDRAAFHFLTDAADQEAYLRVMDRALVSGGHAIIGTFALDGPVNCSGLPVTRYDAALLAERLGPGYQLMKSLLHDHHAPWNRVQRFHFGLFMKD
ncbi:class I SAM-dependent methyltransferase [Psychromarinibacter sp. C21-152]|uniref:Class I SAM-dependent methyltransferase n=1 Tax=Psychromarinibacter sediminicola TaxID=3033385 RepID=A0AAE3NWN3_9RHOB|nr:class I SAM-dependent methyltransferase [Psychromarinibacter sediminicola]MDF0603589.1 class I SAM-dependent methyltransferase [Psychromarinibacter sediminicola]